MSDFVYNGKFYKDGTPIIGSDNRGLRYGDGLFETMKMINGKIILQDEHFARLWKGLSVLGFSIPKHFEPEKLIDEIRTLAKKNKHENAARIRLSIIRGNGGLYDVENNFPNYIIQTWSLSDDIVTNYGWNNNGLVVGFYEEARKNCDKLSNVKTNNCLPYVLAADFAKKNKWNEAILLNCFDRICESTIANIFIIKNEVLLTPSLQEGCVAGVMRGELINRLKNQHFEIKETQLAKEDIRNADEVFLTNSISNIRWIKSIEEKEYVNHLAKKIQQQVLPNIFA